ncbi:hypothetical protein GE107_21095 [Cohnella sp. CFH 77786]|uniref:hypothetical protein n=1 Tax=Cohnella sp. CFH 77786 TaxID=2662265 RepID=UPI001C60EF34|nr:hypothetical protein [Cohnella sp. CFH 77786]MBW5448547.1 hypothetical protein [Cohnella sp. CFH 77786]
MHATTGRQTGDQARQWMHQPVCVVLKDGSCRIGWVTAVDRDTLTLVEAMDAGKRNRTFGKRNGRAVIAGFGAAGFGAAAPTFNPVQGQGGGWGGLFGFPPFGATGNAGAGGGWGGFAGFVKQIWPPIQIGLGIVRAVMPLFGGFKI